MRAPQEQDGQAPVQFVFIEHPLCTSGIGLEGGEYKWAQRPICPLPLPPSSHRELAQLSRTQSSQYVCGDPCPCLHGASGSVSPLPVVWLPMTPKGLLAKLCSLDSVFSLSVLPSQHLLALAPAPAPVCPCKHKSAVCADKAVRRSGGRAYRRDISRELWGQWLGGQRPLSDSRDLASPSRGLGRAPGASGCGW